MSDLTAAEPWNEQGLRNRCERLREALLVRSHAAEEELQPYWPGGEENREEDALGRWIYCYGQLSRLLDRLNPDPGPLRIAEAERAVLAALRAEPEVVELPRPLRDGRGWLAVYPKSLHALLHMAARDQILGRLAVGIEFLRERDNDGDVATLLNALTSELSFQQRCQLWAACEPSPGLPYSDESLYPEPPGWTEDVEVVSLLQVMRAHNLVNGQRLNALRRMLQSRNGAKGDKQRLSWATLAVLAGQELNTDAGRLLRERSLDSWLAQLVVRADTRAQAREEARSATAAVG